MTASLTPARLAEIEAQGLDDACDDLLASELRAAIRDLLAERRRPVGDFQPDQTCEICGSADQVGCFPIMNRHRGPPPTVCSGCFAVWYQEDLTSAPAIRQWRGIPEPPHDD